MKQLEIKVQQKHINRGTQNDAHTCAIAEALKDQFGAEDVEVSGDEIKMSKSNGFSFDLSWTKIPQLVKNFISKFDNDKKSVKPFSFKLPFLG